MKKIKEIIISSLAVISSACLITGSALRLQSASANGTEVTYGKETVSTLATDDLKIKNVNANTDLEGVINFADCSVEKEAVATYANELTGEYYVDFFVGACPEAGDRPYVYVHFGGDTKGNSIENSVTIGIRANGMLNTEGTAFVLNPNDRNGWLVSTYVRFVVNAEGNIEVYQEKEPIDVTKHTPRGYYALDNADFSLTDGYFAVSNGLVDSSVTTKNLTIPVSKFHIECLEKQIYGENEAMFAAVDSFAYNSNKITEERLFNTVDQAKLEDNSILKSRFEISDEGVADGEKVFEMSYSIYRNTSNGASHVNKQWGVGFGLTEGDTKITSSDKAVLFNYNTFSAFGVTNDHLCSYNSNWRSVTITGYAGGMVEASFLCPNCTETFTVTAENVDFNGQFAFGIFGEAEEGKKFRVTEFSFDGNVSYPSAIEIDKDDFKGLKAGADVALYNKATALGGFYKDTDIVWEVKSGVGSITNGIFHTDTIGSTTLRASINGKENIYQEVTFENAKPDGVIVFNEGLLSAVCKEDIVNLNAYYTTNPVIPVEQGVTYSIISGSEFVSLADGVLTAKKAGSVTLRITSVYDTAFYKDYDFEVSPLTRYSIKLNEEFDSLESGRWVAKNIEEGTLAVDGSVTFATSFNTEEGKSPKLVYNIPVCADTSTGVVFDITFTARKTSGVNKETANFGLMFAMPSMDSEIVDSNVGYLNFTPTGFEMYRSGQKIESEKMITASADFAYSTVATTVRLIAMSDGTLQLYVGKSYGDFSLKLEDLYATYSGFDFNNTYLAFATNETYVEGKAFAIRVSGVTLITSCMLDANTVEIQDVLFDDSVLSDLYAIEKPVGINYTIRANYNISPFTDGKIEIINGQATVSGNSIIFHTPGSVTFRISSTFDSTKYKDYTVNVKQLVIESITIKTEKFVDITTDSQPLDLKAVIVANTYIDKYLSVTFSVVSGQAEIARNQLRILGAGTVVIRATSDAVPTEYAEFTFEVADANANYVAPTLPLLNGCQGVIDGTPIIGGLLIAFSVLCFIRKKEID